MSRLGHVPAFAVTAGRLPLGPTGSKHSQVRWAATATQDRPRASPSPVLKGPFRLAPSDFAFLWNECKRCFYFKAHKKLYRPRAPFPSIFGTIDSGMKTHFRGLPTQKLIPEMKPGTFLCEENDAWVECKPITPPGHSQSVYIRGMVRFGDTSAVARFPEIAPSGALVLTPCFLLPVFRPLLFLLFMFFHETTTDRLPGAFRRRHSRSSGLQNVASCEIIFDVRATTARLHLRY